MIIKQGRLSDLLSDLTDEFDNAEETKDTETIRALINVIACLIDRVDWLEEQLSQSEAA